MESDIYAKVCPWIISLKIAVHHPSVRQLPFANDVFPACTHVRQSPPNSFLCSSTTSCSWTLKLVLQVLQLHRVLLRDGPRRCYDIWQEDSQCQGKVERRKACRRLAQRCTGASFRILAKDLSVRARGNRNLFSQCYNNCLKCGKERSRKGHLPCRG